LTSACSEKASVNTQNAKADREAKKAKAAQDKAEKDKKDREIAEAKTRQDSLAGKSAADLEAIQAKAFSSFSAKQAELAAKSKITDADKIALETLKRDWEATKTAKANIVRGNLTKKLKQTKLDEGLEGLRKLVTASSQK